VPVAHTSRFFRCVRLSALYRRVVVAVYIILRGVRQQGKLVDGNAEFRFPETLRPVLPRAVNPEERAAEIHKSNLCATIYNPVKRGLVALPGRWEVVKLEILFP
jgi:hypothetical protein